MDETTTPRMPAPSAPRPSVPRPKAAPKAAKRVAPKRRRRTVRRRRRRSTGEFGSTLAELTALVKLYRLMKRV